MSSFWPIFKRELRAYFVSPIAYVVMVMFLMIAGYFFYSSFAFFNFIGFQAMSNPMMARNLNVTEGVLRPLYGNLGVVLLFIMPLLTMRLFAEEKKQGTIELLLTYPVRDLAAVLAKFSACLAVYTIMLALTALYPVLLIIFAQPEVGPILAGYVGLIPARRRLYRPGGAGLVADGESDRRRRHQLRVFAVLLGHRLVVAIRWQRRRTAALPSLPFGTFR